MAEDFRRSSDRPAVLERRSGRPPEAGQQKRMPPVFARLTTDPRMGIVARAAQSMEALVVKELEVSRQLLRLLAGQTPLSLGQAYRFYFESMVDAGRLHAYRSARDKALHGQIAAFREAGGIRLEPIQEVLARDVDPLVHAALTHNRIVYLSRGRMYSIDRKDVRARIDVEACAGGVESRLIIPLDGDYGMLHVAGPDLTFGQLWRKHEAAALTALDLSNILSLKHAAEIDSLTGVHNRRAFDTMLRHFVGGYLTGGPDIALVMFDADHFKRVNDTYGHGTGDEILAMCAATASTTLRATDLVGRLPGTGIALPGEMARYGGEEFALLLPGVDTAGAAVAAMRCKEAIASRTVKGPNLEEVGVTISMGIATASLAQKMTSTDAMPVVIDAEGDVSDPLLGLMAGIKRLADEALYQAKAMGRNVVVLAQGRNGPEGPEVVFNKVS